MRKLLFIPLLFLSINSFSAKRITELPELTAPATSDLLIVVDDVVGTPTTKKMLIENMLNTSLIDHINILSTGTLTHAEIDSELSALDTSTTSLRTDLDAVIISTGTFLKQDGSTPLTADWNAGSFKITASTFTADAIESDKIIKNNIIFGEGTNNNITFTFNTNSVDGLFTWDKSTDQFAFDDCIILNSEERLYLRDSALYLYSSVNGQLDIDADVEVEITAPTIDVNGLINGTTCQFSSGTITNIYNPDTIYWSDGTIQVSSPIAGITDHILLTSTGTNTHAQIDSQLSSLDTSTTTLASSITNLETSTSTLEGYIFTLWTSTSTLETSIINLEASTSTLEGYISTLWTSTSTLEGYIFNLWTSTSALESRIDTAEIDITNLETSTSTLEGYVFTLWTSTQTLETAIALNTTHRSSDGSDHTFIDQDVTITGTPTFSSMTITNDMIASNLNATYGVSASTGEFTGQVQSNNRKLVDEYSFGVVVTTPNALGTNVGTRISPYYDYDVTYTTITAICSDGTNVIFKVDQRQWSISANPYDAEGTDIWVGLSTATASGYTGGTVSDFTVPAGYALFISTTDFSVSGDVGRLDFHMEYTKD